MDLIRKNMGECTVTKLSTGSFVLQPWGYKIELHIEDTPKVAEQFNIRISKYNKFSLDATSTTFLDMLVEIFTAHRNSL